MATKEHKELGIVEFSRKFDLANNRKVSRDDFNKAYRVSRVSLRTGVYRGGVTVREEYALKAASECLDKRGYQPCPPGAILEAAAARQEAASADLPWLKCSAKAALDEARYRTTR